MKTIKTLDGELNSILNFTKFVKEEITDIPIRYKKRAFLITADGKRIKCDAILNSESDNGDEVWIARGLPPQEKVKSLIHELLHNYYDALDRNVRDCIVERQTQKIYRHWPHFAEKLGSYLPVEPGSS